MKLLSVRALMSKRTRGVRLLIIVNLFLLAYLGSVFWDYNSLPGPSFEDGEAAYAVDSQAVHYQHRHLLSNNSNYPPEVFSLKQRRQGAVILHVFGMIYMFVALAVVCDEFFVPALTVITERLAISEDVAGATFMAAGGSAPELFTSIIGVFIAKNDVGISTIVGSAVFNILFVIGMCALFSKELLHLTWWPLFRDVFCYSVSLVLLIYFFGDDLIYWWEAFILFLCYISYVLFMKVNHIAEAKVKACIRRPKTVNKVQSTDQLIEESHPPHRRERLGSLPILHAGAGRYRHGVLQLMIHTIDPLSEAANDHMTHRLNEARRGSTATRRRSSNAARADMHTTEEGKLQDKALQLQAIATVQLVINHGNNTTDQNGTISQVDRENNVKIQMISNGRVSEEQSPSATPNSQLDRADPRLTNRDVNITVNDSPLHDSNNSDTNAEEKLEEEDEPLDLSWPDTWKKRITYVLLAPIMFPLYVTLPDVRRPEKKKWFPVTFIVSILWIAGFSYLMVWWANQTGETIGIPDEVMGLTILAAGTSIPDLITSVIVAKKGFGDMAVSSSVGSNIFDITVGLPVPWMLYGAINGGDPYRVSSKGLWCSIILLFIMLLCVIVSIAVSKWKMSKALGFAMLVLYSVFVTISVLLEYQIIKCNA
ncbi:sodium/potassium/calcium exchanger 2-like isoform X2 [Littorina saxatilis]|uniref:Sodium/calcium exchanger membrane region domain-containing protein n=1 Tax=Littorina saxatilis TaxID=31220 RepID=A0AAN9C166_9CAEN